MHLVSYYEEKGYSLKGSNISMDRYYTSIHQAEKLFSKGITVIGTIRHNRKGISHKRYKRKRRT